MRVIKTIKQGLVYKTFYQENHFRFSVGALSYFKLDDPRTLGSEPEMWETITQELHPDAIFDFGLPKPHSEVLVYGDCCAPSGKAVRQLSVDLQFDKIKKRLLVSGDRYWVHNANVFSSGWAPTEPKPFERMNIGWMNAFGGPEFQENPFGKGHILFTDSMDVLGQNPLPNVESVASIARTPKEKLMPGGMGAIELTWPQRMHKSGKYNQRWFEKEFPGFPANMDWSFFNAAPADQQLAGYFTGAETYSITNMHPDNQRITGMLPDVKSRCFIHVRDESDALQWSEIPLHLETVWLFPTRGWGILLQRGTTDVGTFLGTDVETLLLAYEYVGEESRTPQQYLESVRRRDDDEISMFWNSREDDLRPPGDPLSADEVEERNAEVAAVENGGQPPNEIGQEGTSATQDEGMGLRKHLSPRLSSAEKEELAAIEKAKAEATEQNLDLASSLPQLSLAEERSKLNLPHVADDDHCQAALMDYLQQNYLYGEELFATVLKEEEADVVALTALAKQSEEAVREMCAMYGVDMDERRKESELKFFDIDDEYYEEATTQYVAEHFSCDGNPYYLPLRLVDDDYVIANAIAVREEHKLEKLADEHGIDLAKKKEEAKKNEKQALADLAAPLREMRANLKDHPAEQKKLEKAIEETEQMQPEMDALLAEAEKDEKFQEPKIDRRMVELMHQKGEVFDELDLTGIDLSNLDLAGASFQNTILVGANLSDTILSGANFLEAVLDRADFSFADLVGAQFVGAQIEKVIFGNTKLSNTNFDDSAVVFTRFISCDLTNVSLAADTVEKSVFLGCDLSAAQLSSTAFYECSFKNSKLDGANCEGSDFNSCVLEKTDFSNSNLKETSFVDVRALEVRFFNANMEQANAHLKCDFSKGDFRNANCLLASFGGSNMTMTNFSGAILNEADFSQCQLQRAVFDGAVARGTFFLDANMQYASMQGIDLLRASIEGANLKYSNLSNAQLFETEAMFANTEGSTFKRTKVERTMFKNK